MKTKGSIKRMMSCTMADAELAYAAPCMSIHLPLISRFQNEYTGLQAKIAMKKITRLLMTKYPRKTYAVIWNLRVLKISR